MKRKALLFEVLLAMLLVAIFSSFALSYPLQGLKQHVAEIRTVHMKQIAQESLPDIVLALQSLSFQEIGRNKQTISLPPCGAVSRQIEVHTRSSTRYEESTQKGYKKALVTLILQQGTVQTKTKYQLVVHEKEKPIYSS